jgi:cation diffusion facilitator family transporter
MATIDTEVQSSGVRRVLWITLALNIAVSAGKVIVGHLSGSLAMVADGYHSLVDGSNNVLGLIVSAFAFRPPDAAHPYGHRKFETAATLLIGAALMTLAWELFSGALSRTTKPELPEIGYLNWVVMAATIAVNVGVSWYEAREGRRLKSAFLVADATHTRADLYVSLGVVASFVAAKLGAAWADPLVAVAIAGIIAWQAAQILVSAFNVLTDRAPIRSAALEPLAAAVSGVRHVHDVRTRGRRDAVFVDLTVHLDGGILLREAHAVADRIEAALQAAHPEIVDVVVHLEPEGHEAEAASAV